MALAARGIESLSPVGLHVLSRRPVIDKTCGIDDLSLDVESGTEGAAHPPRPVSWSARHPGCLGSDERPIPNRLHVVLRPFARQVVEQAGCESVAGICWAGLLFEEPLQVLQAPGDGAARALGFMSLLPLLANLAGGDLLSALGQRVEHGDLLIG